MLATRVIPCLLLRNGGLVKTTRFRNPTYVGDPINAVRIFNDKEVDELAFLDITATREGRGPNFGTLEQIANEAFMPVAYGGGVTTVDEVQRIIQLGIEKVIVNTAAVLDLNFLRAAADLVGSQSVVVSIDTKKRRFRGGHRLHSHCGTRATRQDPVEFARAVAAAGAGEIVLNSIDRDGMRTGYDLPLLASVTSAVSIPVIALGGAGSLQDMVSAVQEGGSAAVAAGSFFVFHGKHRAVLITYPEREQLEAVFGNVRTDACIESAPAA